MTFLPAAQRCREKEKVKDECHDIMRQANLLPIYFNFLVLFTYVCMNKDKYTQLSIQRQPLCSV